MAYTTRIDILRPREVKDRYSSDATSLDYSDPIVIPVERRVSLQPAASREQGDFRHGVISGWSLVTPVGMDIDLRSIDRVRHGDRVLEVLGDVVRWPHPIRPELVHHVEATLEEVRG
ncbi:hypothetical protein [Rhodococcus sp. 14-2470-1a]|uniref:hypothetical protein n=1 Tax=Rhodococcus sp. 14-2470-1a TaxID=2023150 RepID=UPI000B9AE616|nr:hypothetical protein [Rhodococcus sp. 14-2470-1a]OZF41913.1 hypothetical protein CH292_27285 [Rhodococcus sp. 14-2470-1a]